MRVIICWDLVAPVRTKSPHCEMTKMDKDDPESDGSQSGFRIWGIKPA